MDLETMVAYWMCRRPDGRFRHAAPSEVKIAAGQISAACATAGAVIGGTAVPGSFTPPRLPPRAARRSGSGRTASATWQANRHPFQSYD
ncbi:MAG: hypothetical protein KC425_03895 [Anaerolineales bacterium]|nr:hypothetical protein [Anaerolineales bacterium]